MTHILLQFGKLPNNMDVWLARVTQIMSVGSSSFSLVLEIELRAGSNVLVNYFTNELFLCSYFFLNYMYLGCSAEKIPLHPC